MLGLVQHRHQGSGEGALAKETAKQIGDLEGDEEGIRARTRPEEARDQQITAKAEEARQQGGAADQDQGGGKLGQVTPAAAAGIPRRRGSELPLVFLVLGLLAAGDLGLAAQVPDLLALGNAPVPGAGLLGDSEFGKEHLAQETVTELEQG